MPVVWREVPAVGAQPAPLHGMRYSARNRRKTGAQMNAADLIAAWGFAIAGLALLVLVYRMGGDR